MEKLKLFISLSWRNLWRNYRRTLITFSSIGVGVWAMIVLASLMEAWAMSTFNASINTLTGHAQIHAEQYLQDPNIEYRIDIPDKKQTELLNSDSVKAWSVRIRVPAIVQSERDNSPVMLVGINPQTENSLSFIPDSITKGNYLSDGNSPGILLGKKLAKRLRTDLNKRVVILSQGPNGDIKERGFRVVGIYEVEQEDTETQYAFVSLNKAQHMLNVDTTISEISFVLHDLEELDNFINQYKLLNTQKNITQDIKSWAELEPFTLALLDMTSGTIALLTVIMFILIAFGLVNTLLMAVYERTREFGLLQALGMKPTYILYMILIESTFLMGIGVIVGTLLSLSTIEFFSNGLDLGALAEGSTMFGAGRVMYPEIHWLQSSVIAMFVWIMGIVTSLYPAWRASREVPVETINKAY
jgi:ABC-type lipoprotein release transport system permease subunit